MRKLLFIATIISASLLFSCGGGNIDKKDEKKDSVKTEKKEVKKTREQLIVNRDTMSYVDVNAPTDFEKKHTPNIKIGAKDEKGYSHIKITVGIDGIVHPASEAHWIDFLTLYLDGKEFKHLEFENNSEQTNVEFFVPLENVKKVKATIGCNLHGIWSKEAEIK